MPSEFPVVQEESTAVGVVETVCVCVCVCGGGGGEVCGCACVGVGVHDCSSPFTRAGNRLRF